MARETVDVVLEVGRKRTFASAIDWPGWSRSGKTAEAALDALAAYADRYAIVVERAGLTLPRGELSFTTVESLTGNATTDFGAPGVVADVERAPLNAAQCERLVALLGAAWGHLDDVASSAPAELRKGPRGGGRDTAEVHEHVVGHESAYARKLGVATRGVADVRPLVLAELGTAYTRDPAESAWPPSYAAMRIAWHALDHAWEIQDRST